MTDTDTGEVGLDPRYVGLDLTSRDLTLGHLRWLVEQTSQERDDAPVLLRYDDQYDKLEGLHVYVNGLGEKR